MFDTWFSNPHQIVQISQRGLNVIAMVKKRSKITYEFEEKRMNVKQIFNACKKRRGRSRYLLSVPVKVGGPAKDGAQIDARIVCVRNRSNRKDWIALICTDMTTMKMRSSEFTAKDGTSRSSSRPARVS
ncbi:transposase [Lactobacillus delbrueckii subsp. bulgaricus]|nr:transposase [Lactobacillus delbrueckii subsp. bulgaricus]